MAKESIFFVLLIINISFACSLTLKSKMKTTTSTFTSLEATLHDPSNGCTISLKKMKEDKVQAISFISEMQSSLGLFSTCML